MASVEIVRMDASAVRAWMHAAATSKSGESLVLSDAREEVSGMITADAKVTKPSGSHLEHARTCSECGEPFISANKNAVTCSPAHRVARHRRQERERLVAEQEALGLG